MDEIALAKAEAADYDWNKRMENHVFGGPVVGSKARKLDESQEPPYSADESDGDDDADGDGVVDLTGGELSPERGMDDMDVNSDINSDDDDDMMDI